MGADEADLGVVLHSQRAGTPFLAAHYRPARRRQHGTARWSGLLALLLVLPVLVGLLTLAEHLFGRSLQIEALLVNERLTATASATSFRMAPESAVSHTLLAIALWLNMHPSLARRRLMISSFLSIMVVALAVSAMSTYFSPALGMFGWFGLSVMAGDAAILFMLLGTASFLMVCRQKTFSWELGKTTTTGFALGTALLVIIGITAIRSQYEVSETNRRLSNADTLYARSADTYSYIAQHQSFILSYLLTNDLRSLNSAQVAVDRARFMIDELGNGNSPLGQLYSARIPFMERTTTLLKWSSETLTTIRRGLKTEEKTAIATEGLSVDRYLGRGAARPMHQATGQAA